jgi:hypothetical protein
MHMAGGRGCTGGGRGMHVHPVHPPRVRPWVLITMNVKVPWTVPWPDYSPPDFTTPFVLTAAWADPPLDSIAHDEKRGGFITMNDRVPLVCALA